jgi:integrase
MRGSVIRRGDVYYVKIELDPVSATGKRRTKWHSGYRTKREAERARVDLLSKFDRGVYVEPSQETVTEFLEHWLVSIRPTLKATTWNGYRSKVRNHVIPYIGGMRLARVDGGTLNELYAKLLTGGRKKPSRTGKGYSPAVVARAQALREDGLSLQATADRLQVEFDEASHITKDTLASLLRRQAAHRVDPTVTDDSLALDPSTVKAVHVALHKAFGAAVKWERLVKNPADQADPPRVPVEADKMPTWTADQLRTFLEFTASIEDRNHALWVLLATTGMRRGEALGVRWQDVDLDSGRLRVVQTVLSINGKISVSEPKTARGRRPISLDPSTVAALREHRRRMLEERMVVAADHADEGLVFHRPDGSALRPETVSTTFLRRQRTLDLPRLTLKGLRHTWATLALEQGINPKVVQERLGHSTVNITLNVYSHVSPTMHAEAANLVAELFLSPAPTPGRSIEASVDTSRH